MDKSGLSLESSRIVSNAAILLWLAGGILCAVFDFGLLSGLLFFLCLIACVARFWGARVMDKLRIELECSRTRMYPGDETELIYTVSNDKLLPMIWLELSQNSADRDCLVPDEGFERYTYHGSDCPGIVDAYRRSFSFIMGMESLRLESRWHAVRRGIYRPDRLLLRSGDGFGLCQIEKKYPTEKIPELVVYPRKIPVELSPVLVYDWEQSAGAAGHQEDMSVIRGVRPYRPNDSWKRINWRMAAREGGELRVNTFETVQPISAFFVLDGESFCESENFETELEDVLELLGSVITELFERRIACGLCLPVSKRFPAVELAADENRSAAELLFYLAGYDCLCTPERNAEGVLTGHVLPSEFNISAAAHCASQCGRVYLISRSADKLPETLLGRLDTAALTVFTYTAGRAGDPQLRCLCLDALRKKVRA